MHIIRVELMCGSQRVCWCMVHICCRHSGNMAGAEAERNEGTCLARIIQVCAAFCRGADLGAASSAERIRAGHGYGLRGGGGGAPPPPPPAVRYGYLLYLNPIPGWIRVSL